MKSLRLLLAFAFASLLTFSAARAHDDHEKATDKEKPAAKCETDCCKEKKDGAKEESCCEPEAKSEKKAEQSETKK